MSLRAVIFDLGGVVMDSPLHLIADYERELGIPANHVNRVVVETGPAGAWSRLERGELELEAFYPEFDRECEAAGHKISAREMMRRIAEFAQPRPAMIRAIEALRTKAYRTAALTNNWKGDEIGRRAQQLGDLFDVFIESAVVGLRKPDPRIYQLVCDRLEVSPEESIFLDDIGRNLKAARGLGMKTIKVTSASQALGELGEALGLELGEGGAGLSENRDYQRTLGVIECFKAVTEQCPKGPARAIAEAALAMVEREGAGALPNQAYLVLSALRGWRGERAQQVHRSLETFLNRSPGRKPREAPTAR